MASVAYEHVTKRYGTVVALNDLDIRIVDKEFLVLVGPSGCGKSTALRCLAGLEDVSEGRVLIGDQVVNHVRARDRDLAMVFQSYALYPHMSVYENMAFALELRNMPRDEIVRRVRQAAQDLGIDGLLDRRPAQLSGGQRQRVAVGRAIVREPKVFLMDEPLSNLDAKLRVEARTMISKLHQRLGTTFVYVTHDQTEAMTMGSRIAVLNAGRLQQLDTPQDLYDRPNNVFVAGFIGSPAMNFFDATLVGAGDELQVDAGAFRLTLPADKARAARGYSGKKVILGIRPENIHAAQFAPPGIHPQFVTTRVDMTELMGSEIYVYLLAGDRTFIARVDPRTEAAAGRDLELAVNMDKVHLFDPETQQAIR